MPNDFNPFEEWLPLYGTTMHAAPWWRNVQDGTTRRVDGWAIRRSREQSGAFDARAPGADREDWRMIPSCGSLVEAVQRIDAAHPLAAPPPMVGQAWCWARTREVRAVVATSRHGVVFGDGTQIDREDWPPPDAVLVAGPTPWGHHVPWASPGWRP